MAKASILFPCLIALFLITFGTDFGDACVEQYKCKVATDCENVKCIYPVCTHVCVAGCCSCNCEEASRENVSPRIHLNKL
ncbi:hypothetical protein PHAVU_006G066700 [Phaseolus vulgaris]|uniref:Uncharacterized protein n=1 Tax=Phaseolus vulgaris TaxID=3885 RepID=V7BNW5_PHAVU|nr:hypothetical protein PHAVU_006G066700g [Phaseolus vulgaris]ESW18745.1 hypothetical protein PHAVU_006G066700g [Phaseolus vulgaris]